jgi:hypothetical protein
MELATAIGNLIIYPLIFDHIYRILNRRVKVVLQ